MLVERSQRLPGVPRKSPKAEGRLGRPRDAKGGHARPGGQTSKFAQAILGLPFDRGDEKQGSGQATGEIVS